MAEDYYLQKEHLQEIWCQHTEGIGWLQICRCISVLCFKIFFLPSFIFEKILDYFYCAVKTISVFVGRGSVYVWGGSLLRSGTNMTQATKTHTL